MSHALRLFEIQGDKKMILGFLSSVIPEVHYAGELKTVEKTPYCM